MADQWGHTVGIMGFTLSLNVVADRFIRRTVHFIFTACTDLCLQLALTLLQFGDVSSALRQHGLLLLEGKLQLHVLLIGVLTNQTSAVELLLQRGHLKNRRAGRMCMQEVCTSLSCKWPQPR